MAEKAKLTVEYLFKEFPVECHRVMEDRQVPWNPWHKWEWVGHSSPDSTYFVGWKEPVHWPSRVATLNDLLGAAMRWLAGKPKYLRTHYTGEWPSEHIRSLLEEVSEHVKAEKEG